VKRLPAKGEARVAPLEARMAALETTVRALAVGLAGSLERWAENAGDAR
jgi:hypothetical protein